MDGSISSRNSFAYFTYLVATKQFLNYTEYKKVTSTNIISCMKNIDQATGQELSLWETNSMTFISNLIEPCMLQVFYDNADVKQVDVPSFSGSFGILPKHVPTLAVLKPGVVTVFENDGTTKKIFVSSGTVSINDDSSVQVLAEEACPVEHLDAAAAREVLSKAQSDLASASTEIAKAEAAIAVEVGEALVKAAE